MDREKARPAAKAIAREEDPELDCVIAFMWEIIMRLSIALGLCYLLVVIQPARGGEFYSEKSLLLLCATEDTASLAICENYIRGVIETFYLLSERGRLTGGQQYLCKQVGQQNWDIIIQIVKSNLPTMERGFAAFEIVAAVDKAICK